MAAKKAVPAEPESTDSKTKKVTLYLSKPLATRLRVRSAETEQTQSEIAERALEAYLTAKR